MENIYFDDKFDFALHFTKTEDHWFDFNILETVQGWEDNKTIFIGFRNSEDWNDFENKDYTKAEIICNGHIKWDGCMELHNLNYHFCGYSDILQRITKLIYIKANELMPRFDKDLANLKSI